MGGPCGVVTRDDCVKEIEGGEATSMAEYSISGSQKFSQTTLPVCGLLLYFVNVYHQST